jgi:hypothetical protein
MEVKGCSDPTQYTVVSEEGLVMACRNLAFRLLRDCDNQRFGYRMQAQIDTAIKLIHTAMQLKPAQPNSPLGD